MRKADHVLVLLCKQSWHHELLEKVSETPRGHWLYFDNSCSTWILHVLTKATSCSNNAPEFLPFLSYVVSFHSLQSFPSHTLHYYLSTLKRSSFPISSPSSSDPISHLSLTAKLSKRGPVLCRRRCGGRRRRAIRTYEWEVKSAPSH